MHVQEKIGGIAKNLNRKALLIKCILKILTFETEKLLELNFFDSLIYMIERI